VAALVCDPRLEESGAGLTTLTVGDGSAAGVAADAMAGASAITTRTRAVHTTAAANGLRLVER
jgi:hypothetical protein